MGQCLLMFAKLLFSFSLNFVLWRVKLSPCFCYHQMWIFVLHVFEVQTTSGRIWYSGTSQLYSSVYVCVAPGLWFSDLDVADVTLCFACPSYYSVCCKHWVTGISRVGVFPVAGIQCPFYSGFSSLGWGCGCGLDWWAGGGGPGRWINNKLQFWEEGQLLIPW